MKDPIKILLVTDCQRQEDRIVSRLEHEGYTPSTRRVDTPQACAEALKEGPWDVVLTKPHLPSFTETPVPRAVKKLSPQQPTICVTNGQPDFGDSNLANLGADSTIPEARLDLLVPAVEKHHKQGRKPFRGDPAGLQALLDAAPSAVVLLDSDGRVENWNRAAEELFSVQGRLATKKPHPFQQASLAPLADAIRRALRDRKPADVRVNPGNSPPGLLVRVRPLEGREGGALILAEPPDYLPSSPFSQMELELGAEALKTSPALCVAISQSGKILMMNDTMLEKVGYQDREVLGRDYVDMLVPWEDRHDLSEVFRTLIREKKETLSVNRILHRNGTEITVEWHGKPIINDHGQVEYFVGLGLDVSERVRTEEALRESEEKFRRLFHGVNDAIYLYSIDQAGKAGPFIEVNGTTCRQLGYTRHEMLKMTPLEIEAREYHGVLMSSLKSLLEQGYVTYYSVHTSRDGMRVPVEISAQLFPLNGQQAVLSIARDVTQRRLTEDKLQKSVNRLKRAVEGTVQAMAVATEMRDPYTAGHQRRVSRLAAAIARRMNLPKGDVNGIRMAAAIHDLGKICIPAEILSKPGELNRYEISIIRTHPQVGYEILKEIDFPWPVAETVLQHHERIDRSGYPQGLSGDQIGLGARILAVADVVEAMSSHRPYRPALGIEEALAEIAEGRGRLYDARVADACLELFQEESFRLDPLG